MTNLHGEKILTTLDPFLPELELLYKDIHEPGGEPSSGRRAKEAASGRPEESGAVVC